MCLRGENDGMVYSMDEIILNYIILKTQFQLSAIICTDSQHAKAKLAKKPEWY